MVLVRLVRWHRDSPSSPEYIYTIGNFISFSYDWNSPITPAPLPEETDADNVLVKIEGNSSNGNMSWKIAEAEESVVKRFSADGTEDPIEVRTLVQTLNFFDDLLPNSIEDSMSLIIDFREDAPSAQAVTPSDLVQSETVFRRDGIMTKISVRTTKDSPVTFDATTNFLRGTVVAVYDLDVPSEPLNMSLSLNSINNIVVNWDPPVNDGDVQIQGYRLRFRRLDVPSDWTVRVGSIDSSVRTTTIGVLEDGTYRVQLAAITARGIGRYNTRVIERDTS